MLWSVIEDYFVVFSIGFILGVIATRYVSERITKRSLGKVIEEAVISSNIETLYNQCRELENILDKMMDESENLSGQIKRIGDLEKIQGKPYTLESHMDEEPDKDESDTESNTEKA